jgi:hypothetical protein
MFRRFLIALLSLPLAWGLVLWAVWVLQKADPARVPVAELWSTTNLLAWGTPDPLHPSEWVGAGAVFPLVLQGLLIYLPKRRRFLWWLRAWVLGVGSTLLASWAVVLNSSTFREMVDSGAFSTLELVGNWWRVGWPAVQLGLGSGSIVLGFPLALLLLELVFFVLSPKKLLNPLRADTAQSTPPNGG